MTATYSDFIAQKRKRHTPSGFDCDRDWPDLFPHQKPIVRWALRMGKAAIFLDRIEAMGWTLAGYQAAVDCAARGLPADIEQLRDYALRVVSHG